MASTKKKGKGFCPFCGMEFSGDHDACPFCGQNLKQYKDDLGPIMESIQTATNIDMKSPKVRITMSIIIFIMVFAGALVIFDYYEKSQPAQSEIPEPEPTIDTVGLMIEVPSNGYLDMTGDFQNGSLMITPRYNPDLEFYIHLNDSYSGRYYKIMWVVQTDVYNGTNAKNPFYQKVTKEEGISADIYGVTWDNVSMGRFWITAQCFSENGGTDVFSGDGIYYGKSAKTYSWTHNGNLVTMEFELTTDQVRECIAADMTERAEMQSDISMKDRVVSDGAVKDLNDKLKSLFTVNFRYSDAEYADFVLTFVQDCFPNVYDSFNYRVDDYWATPTETLFYGCGDDEDKAILFCSIMKAAGMDAGLLTLPHTVIAAVDIDISDNPIIVYAKRVRGLYSSMYVVADTSSDLGLGQVRGIYDFTSDGRSMIYNGVTTLILDRFEKV